MTLPTIKKALDKMAVENTPTAIDAANAAIMKSVETTALDVLRCFKGHAHTMCTELGISHFSAWRDTSCYAKVLAMTPSWFTSCASWPPKVQ